MAWGSWREHHRGGDIYIRFDEMARAERIGKGHLMQRKEHKQSHYGPCFGVARRRNRWNGQTEVGSAYCSV